MNTDISLSVNQLMPAGHPAPTRSVRNWKRECAAVIPCFNEADSIGEVVKSIRRHLSKVIVVDDGSHDRTSEKAIEAGAEVLRHSSNLGKGMALRTGWRHAQKNSFGWTLMLDGDGQHSGEDVSIFLEHVEKTNAPLVVGNRMPNAEAMPWLRRRVNQWMSHRLSKLTGTPLPDSQCGYRLINLDVLSQVSLNADHFEIESEMLVNFLRAGHAVEFVPIEVIYKKEQSKIHPFLDTWRWFRWRQAQRPLRACNTMREP